MAWFGEEGNILHEFDDNPIVSDKLQEGIEALAVVVHETIALYTGNRLKQSTLINKVCEAIRNQEIQLDSADQEEINALVIRCESFVKDISLVLSGHMEAPEISRQEIEIQISEALISALQDHRAVKQNKVALKRRYGAIGIIVVAGIIAGAICFAKKNADENKHNK